MTVRDLWQEMVDLVLNKKIDLDSEVEFNIPDLIDGESVDHIAIRTEVWHGRELTTLEVCP